MIRFCFVTFDKNEEAQKALQVGELEIRGKKLTISDAIKKYNAPSNNCNYITMFLSDSFIHLSD